MPSASDFDHGVLTSQKASVPIVTIHIDLCPGTVESHSVAAQLASDFVNKIRNDLRAEVDDIRSEEQSAITQSLYALNFDVLLEDVLNPDFDCMNLLGRVSIEIEPNLSENSYQLSYSFDGAEDESKVCHDYFIVGLATQKEVCSVEKQDKIRLLNEHAQWILQSGIEEQRPFFDKGLSGTGQVVQVSEYCGGVSFV